MPAAGAGDHASRLTITIKMPPTRRAEQVRQEQEYTQMTAIAIQADSRYRKSQTYVRPFEGILPILERQLRDASGESMRQKLKKFLDLVPCSSCQGFGSSRKRLPCESAPTAFTSSPAPAWARACARSKN
jgi:excinuclease ABC subunit A